MRTSDEVPPSPREAMDLEGAVDVLYVAGEGRSGSTLLSRMLAGPTAFAAGEVRYVWERGLAEDRACECGQPFRSCPFWSQVVERLEQRLGPDVHDVAAMLQAERRLLRTRLAARAIRCADHPEQWRRQELAYADRITVLYQVVREVARRPVVVDSSKLPMYGLLLRGDPALRVSVVHLVRDPRAAAHSWRRMKRLQDSQSQTHMRRRGLAHSCAVWTSSNYLAEALLCRQGSPYVRVRYEDLVEDPRGTVAAIGAALGRDLPSPTIEDGDVLLEPGHAAAGNPDRHVSGFVPLRLDEAWRHQMARTDQALVTALTYPVARRYGYA